MKLEELRLKYGELKERFSLADFDLLDKEFEIKDITNENIILRDIRDRILDKFDEYIKIIEGIVQPDTTLVNMYESKVFDDVQKNEIFKIFKRLMYLQRLSIESDLEDGDEKVAEFIRISFKEWMEIKSKMLEIIVALKNSWTIDDEDKVNVNYWG